MKYFLSKLRFITDIHIGDSESAKSLDSSCMTICADTLFSALCHTALTADGAHGVRKLVEYVSANQLNFSDLQPYSDKHIYIPKPYITPNEKMVSTINIKNRKKMKKITHIPIDFLNSYQNYLYENEDFDIEKTTCIFGEHHVVTKASIRANVQSVPYIVGLYSFYANCGLYLIIGYESSDILEFVRRLLRLLGLSGIGGKVSSGYGKYILTEEVILDDASSPELVRLNQMLKDDNAKNYLLLTSSLPNNNELTEVMEGSSYKIIRRSGFVQPGNSKTPLYKKQTQYFFSSGSVFIKKYQGDIYNVSKQYEHPVYRYSKPIFLGLG